MPFKIVRNDITKMKVDAIVNTANHKPIYSSGTDTAVYKAAGEDELLVARKKIGDIDEGDVAITSGFKLPAQYIIHAVSPLYIDGKQGEADKLRGCYEKSLQLALKHKCKSIAFPLIATGSFRYPKSEGMEIALNVINNFLMKEEMMIYLVVFDNEAVRLSGQLFDDIQSFIDENYVAERQKEEYGYVKELTLLEPEECMDDEQEEDCTSRVLSVSEQSSRPTQSIFPQASQSMAAPKLQTMASKRSLEDLMNNIGETFQQQLFRLIDERGRNDVDVYKKAGKDKKFFSKIRNNVNYQPSKHTVFAFALSLELSLDETKDLLASAGFAFSPASKFDWAMVYVIEHKIYNLYRVDCVLYDLELDQFFCCE